MSKMCRSYAHLLRCRKGTLGTYKSVTSRFWCPVRKVYNFLIEILYKIKNCLHKPYPVHRFCSRLVGGNYFLRGIAWPCPTNVPVKHHSLSVWRLYLWKIKFTCSRVGVIMGLQHPPPSRQSDIFWLYSRVPQKNMFLRAPFKKKQIEGGYDFCTNLF